MKKAALLFALCLSVASLPGQAAPEATRMNAAMSLLESMDMRVTMAHTIDQVTHAEVEKNPDLVPFEGVMLRFMHKHMGYDSIKSELATIYANAFSQAELEELAKFYRTPVGRKMLMKMPELTVAGSRLGEMRVEANLTELEAMIAQEAERLRATSAK